MPQHSRQHLPLKSLLAPYRFDVALEARQTCPKCLLSCRRIATIQPSFERFHEYFRPRTSCSMGDPVQARAKLLREKELMPNLLRVHRNLAAVMCASY